MIHFIRQTTGRLFSKKSVKADTIRIYLIQFLTTFISMASGIIIARVLGPSEKGTLNLFGVLVSFISDIGLLGIGSGFLYYLANKNEPIEKIHGSAVAYTILCGLVVFMLGWIGMPLWRGLFPGLPDWVIILPFILAPATFYLTLWTSIMLGINRAVDSNRIGLISCLFVLIAVAGLWIYRILNVSTMIWATVIINMLIPFAAFIVLYRRFPHLQVDFQLIKKSLAYGSIIYIGNLANVLHYKIDQVMINYWLGPASVGIYALSASWAEKLFMLDNAPISATLYRISSSSPDESSRLTNNVFRTQLVISCMGGLGLALIAYPLIITLYGNAYQDAVVPLMLLVPGIIAWSISKVQSGMLVYNRGLGSFVSKMAVLGSAINVILNFLVLAVFHFGIVGSAVASSLSYGFVAISIMNKCRTVSQEIRFDKSIP